MEKPARCIDCNKSATPRTASMVEEFPGASVGVDKGSGRCVFRVKEVVWWVLPSLVYGGLHTLHALYPAALA